FIGHIKLHDDYSTVDLPEGMPKELFDHLYKVRVCQKPLKISVDNGTAGEQRDAKPAYKGKRDKPAFNKEKPAFKGKPKAHRGSDSAPRKPSKRPASDRK
ncbi:DbpA RNA binding domain-containing protein, partial [Porticoccaceae bacterium]|nr:DbpA RNA binding domain-containing protein [Porticoccaceae bacterium]